MSDLLQDALSALCYAVSTAESAAHDLAGPQQKKDAGEAYEEAEKAIYALAETQRSHVKPSEPDEPKAGGAPLGSEPAPELKSLVDRIIEGERELDGRDPQTLCFLMAEHWRRVAMDYKARANDYDNLKTKYRILRASPSAGIGEPAALAGPKDSATEQGKPNP